MAKKASVYTKTGDKGMTGLVSGARISKSDFRIDLYGEVDELNSHLGVAIASFNSEKVITEFDSTILFLKEIQSRLFDLGSNLACENENREKFQLPQLSLNHVEALEKEMDEMNAELIPLKSFILPGGNIIAAHFHVCRTVCRRVERKLVEFGNTTNELPSYSAEFINRLSDYFFMISRYVNLKLNEEEVMWIPNK
jgi:cob(I)alamin adenosyltransferase